MAQPRVTNDNYTRGLLVDDELLAGVTEHPERPGFFVAFVLSQESGEYLGYEAYPALEGALARINGIERDWIFEATGGCGSTTCKGAKAGKCGGCSKNAGCA